MKALSAVPARPVAVSTTEAVPVPVGSAHTADVADAHPSVAHAVEATRAVGVAEGPKFTPETVTLVPLDTAALAGWANDTTGAGNAQSH